MTCPPIIHHAIHHAWHPIRRRIWHVAAIAAASGCAGTAVAVIPRLPALLAPPTVERPIETPQPVPEPGALWVLASGVAGVVAVRIRK